MYMNFMVKSIIDDHRSSDSIVHPDESGAVALDAVTDAADVVQVAMNSVGVPEDIVCVPENPIGMT